LDSPVDDCVGGAGGRARGSIRELVPGRLSQYQMS